ncbi:MAG TPA: hypothetical protein V6D17_10810, partial [Candidatus Obscuribacterales bacterium]
MLTRLADCSFQIHHSAGWLAYWKGLNDQYTYLIGIPYGSLAWQVTNLAGTNEQKRQNTAQAVAGLFLGLEQMGLTDALNKDGMAANRFIDVVASLGGRIEGGINLSSDRNVRTYPVSQSYPYKDGIGYANMFWFSTGSIANDGGFSKGGAIAEDCTGWLPQEEEHECEPSGGGGGGGGPCCRPYEPPQDFSTGSAAFPYGLDFSRRYSGCHRLEEGILGLGWSHNFERGITEFTSVMQALGEDSPIDAAAAITCSHIVKTLLDLAVPQQQKPFERMVITSCTAVWWADQVFKNSVAVDLGQRTEVFTRLPDGTFNAPHNSAATLTKDQFGIYTYKTPQGMTLTFNASGQLASWAYPSGVTVSLTYNAGKLQSVSNGMGRQLNFVYSGNYLSQVNDGAGRSVSFSVNPTTKQLDSFTDAEGKVFNYVYDQPGRLQKVFAPRSATTPILTRTFDTLGRIASEKNALNQETTYYCAGPRSEEVEPGGLNWIKYYDRRGNVTKITNQLGHSITMEYDCLSRLTKRTQPEGNRSEFSYDAKNNVLSITAYPRPGSPLAPITVSFTYDPVWNKVKTITDPLGRVTTLNYDPANGNLLSVEYPQVDGQTPTVSFTYNSRGQVLTRTDETGIVTKWNYDATTEKLLSVVHDFGTGRLNLTTSFGYDAAG